MLQARARATATPLTATLRITQTPARATALRAMLRTARTKARVVPRAAMVPIKTALQAVRAQARTATSMALAARPMGRKTPTARLMGRRVTPISQARELVLPRERRSTRVTARSLGLPRPTSLARAPRPKSRPYLPAGRALAAIAITTTTTAGPSPACKPSRTRHTCSTKKASSDMVSCTWATTSSRTLTPSPAASSQASSSSTARGAISTSRRVSTAASPRSRNPARPTRITTTTTTAACTPASSTSTTHGISSTRTRGACTPATRKCDASCSLPWLSWAAVNRRRSATLTRSRPTAARTAGTAPAWPRCATSSRLPA